MDIEENTMLKCDTRIGEVPVSAFRRNPNSVSKTNHHTSSNHAFLQQNSARNAFCNRGLSPLSLRSDFGPQRFHPGSYSYHKSIDGRSRIPNSIPNVGSSISLTDIINTIMCDNFTETELKSLKVLICRKLKDKFRKRYEKKRNRSFLFKTKKSKTIREIDSDCCDSPISSNDDIAQVVDSSLSTSIKNNVFPLTQTTNNDIPQPDSTQVCNEVLTLKNIFTKEDTFPLKKINKTTTVAERSQLNDSSGDNNDKEIFSGSENRTELLNTKYSKNSKQIKLASPKIGEECGKNTYEKPFSPNPKENARDIVISSSVQTLNKINHNNEKEDLRNQAQVTKTSEVSKKSMKRKLFTQNVDMLSSKTLGDSAGPIPQTKVDNKEKNKVRRLVTTQSCFYRNVSEEEESVLDLIHKIVPAEQIKATSSKINKTKPGSEVDLISDISDTYSVESLHDTTVDHNSEPTNIKNIDYKTLLDNCKEKNCRVVLHSIEKTHKEGLSSALQRSKCVKSFWDTDIESEMESENVPVWKKKISEDPLEVINSATLNTSANKVKKTGKVLTVQKVINNKKDQNKNLNVVSNIEKANNKEDNFKKLTESKTNTVTQNEKKNSRKNENKNQLKTNKTNRNKVGTVANYIIVKKKKSKKLNNTTQVKNEVVLNSTKKSETTCSIIKNKEIGKVTKENKKATKTKCILNSSLDTSKDVTKNKINIVKTSKTSVLNSKHREIACKDDPNNIKKSKATVMKKIGKTTKAIGKTTKAKFTLNSFLDSSDSFNISNKTGSKQSDRIMETSKRNILLSESNYNISRQSLRQRKIKTTKAKCILNGYINISDSFNISYRKRSKQWDKVMETSKQNLSQLSDSTYNISIQSLRLRKK